MKFENFVKKAVPYGVTILTKSDGNWLFANGIFAKIPDMLGTIGRISNDPETVQILNGHLYESELHGEAFLTGAVLEKPDGKNKDIIRVFTTRSGVPVRITNDQFGMIEKKDMCVIAEFMDGDTYSKALLVGPPDELDYFEPEAIILGMEE